MNVFELRDNIVGDYASFIQGFIKIKDEKIKAKVDASLDAGLLWPESIVQLSPAFEQGESIEQLVGEGVLHPWCADIFSREGKPLKLYKHQSEAIRKASAGRNYVLTTGTGSGKSLTYIIPIVDHILREGSGSGVKAIVVYPMNALANSQEQELNKFLDPDGEGSRFPVTFHRYTGQESQTEKEEIRKNPPDIILTNYVMLELLLTRSEEVGIVKDLQGLKYLVLDELHTYRGRQGADVAMLVRRTREASGSPNIQCVGTSATLASGKTRGEQAIGVAKTASTLFGAKVEPDDVINEYLVRETPEIELDDLEVQNALRGEVEFFANVAEGEEGEDQIKSRFQTSSVYDALKSSRLVSWIESSFGVKREPESGALIRQTPDALSGKGGETEKLAERVDLDKDVCKKAVQKLFMRGYYTNNAIGRPFFAFRLHQFISRGDFVYATAELGPEREIFMNKQVYAPDTDRQKKLYPLVFCRHCGQEFYGVTRVEDLEGMRFEPRDPFEMTLDAEVDRENVGYLYQSVDKPWPKDKEERLKRLPEDWLDAQGGILDSRKRELPENYRVDPLGRVVDDEEPGVETAFVHSPFHFCPYCGASYSAMHTKKTRQDYFHLGGLSSGGRAIATTILALSTVRNLRGSDVDKKAQKILSFTDNRQDASFQAGHLNDFVEISVLRGALYKALASEPEREFEYSDLIDRIVECLDLAPEDYCANQNVKKGKVAQRALEQLKDAIGYRLFCDLQRGVRLNIPNLEQTGLLHIDYDCLDEAAADKDWETKHPALAGADVATRKKVLMTVLRALQRELAINYDWLCDSKLQNFLMKCRDYLLPEWGFDPTVETKDLNSAKTVYPIAKPKRNADSKGYYLSPRGSVGLYLRNAAFPQYGEKLKLEDAQRILQDIFDILVEYGILFKFETKNREVGYQLASRALRWKLGTGELEHYDPIRQPGESEYGENVNAFYQAYYKTFATLLKGIEAREHTAQVQYESREEREKNFRTGDLPILFCSPTMELGVDISELNVVHMRNIPPTPANYAQRSGRAGRSGQPALIMSYCTSGNQHDQYFFRNPKLMTSGAVQTPQIDLTNERLIRSHVHAIWLTEAAQRLKFSLGVTLKSVLDIATPDDGGIPTCALLPQVVDALNNAEVKKRALGHAKNVLDQTQKELEDAKWYDEHWLDEVFNQLQTSFDSACKRWRELYRAAKKQDRDYHEEQGDASRSDFEIKEARRLRAQAEAQLDQLQNEEHADRSDFYSYRYFASEGFLPGYNFPRLPVTAFLPGEKGRKNDSEYLSRPRFLAISEFGPKAIVYHEGAKYLVNSVTLPVEERTEDAALPLKKVCVCPRCGCCHKAESNVDVCTFCHASLGGYFQNLLEFKNVTAKRRQRINCDEEERMRFGYDIVTAFRFSGSGADAYTRSEIYAQTEDGKYCWGTAAYGDSATIYRINNGFRRTNPERRNGFLLDPVSTRWISESDDAAYDENEDAIPDSVKPKYVRPFVEDVKNCLLIQPNHELNVQVFASLQSALRRAIQQKYSLEEMELAVFALPNDDERRLILFYEASEGGAGVLKNLCKEEDFRDVIRIALELCHFDPATGNDLHRAERAEEDCEAACYNCLLSYSNQRDHALLDRHAILDELMALRGAELKVSSSAKPRAQHLEYLRSKAGSEYEKKWLNFIDSKKCKLPTDAQVYIEEANTRPDFVYDDKDTKIVVYVDGPPHEYEARKRVDAQQDELLELYGWTSIRFGAEEEWESILAKYALSFGLR